MLTLCHVIAHPIQVQGKQYLRYYTPCAISPSCTYILHIGTIHFRWIMAHLVWPRSCVLLPGSWIYHVHANLVATMAHPMAQSPRVILT